MSTVLEYTVVQRRNPAHPDTPIRKAQLVNIKEVDTQDIAAYAVANGHVQGGAKATAVTAIFEGCMEAAKALALDGKKLNMSGWIIVAPSLRGPLDESLSINHRVRLYTRVSAAKDLKLDKADFTFKLADAGAVPRLTDVMSATNGTSRKIRKNTAILLLGRNLTWNAGDTINVAWTEGSEEHTLSVTPSSHGDSQFVISWPEVLSELDAGTTVTFTASLKDPDTAAVRSTSIKATIVAAS